MNPATLAAATTITALLLLTTHITLGRVRYLKTLAEKQAVQAQKAWVNGDRRSSQHAYQAASQKQEDYKLFEQYMVRLRALLLAATIITALLTLGVHLG